MSGEVFGGIVYAANFKEYNMKLTLGKLEKIEDLRSVWENEATDFTVWLAKDENLSLLGDTLGIDIELIGREEAAGAFSIDILAEESGTGRKIVIENQLEPTNHDHLGKIITYASVKNAEIIIWIVKKARDEHKQAIECLNEKTDENIGFYLLEIELWKIGDSQVAPKFSIIVAPNDFVKNDKAITIGENTGNKAFYLEYWENFSNYLKENYNKYFFSTSKILPRRGIGIKFKKSKVILWVSISLQKKQVRSLIYFNSKEHEDYFNMKEHKKHIDSCFSESEEVQWREDKNMSLIVKKQMNPSDTEDWENQFLWLVDSCNKLRQILEDYRE